MFSILILVDGSEVYDKAIHVYTITVRMLCRCNASAAKNFQEGASGAILILWYAGIIMQKRAKKRNRGFYG